MGFRKQGSKAPESAREEFLKALKSGLSQSAAATVAGVSHQTGSAWAKSAGIAVDTRHRGIRYPAAVREAFWAALESGASTSQAAVIASVSEVAGQSWVKQAGYVPRTQPADEPESEPVRRPRAPLSFIERCRLEELLESGCPPTQAARRLNRHPDTIGREMARGATSSGYRARIGQDVVEANLKRPKERRLQSRPVLLAEVLKGLETRHSPEQIAGRLRQDFPDDPEMWVSHEAIYQAVYVQPRGELAKDVKSALRTGRIKRKPHGRKDIDSNRGKLKNMVSISERPAEADDRAVPGHWEGDLIIGANSASAIGTLVERTTGFVMLLHLPEDHTAATVAEAMSAKIPQVPEILRRSLTWDQGKEMALHTAITEATGLPIYFCDPHSPWQRGTNEKHQRITSPVLPQGHRPVPPRPRHPRQRRRRTQRPTPQTPQLAHPSRRTRPTTVSPSTFVAATA
jgi:IS30 family transposase